MNGVWYPEVQGQSSCQDAFFSVNDYVNNARTIVCYAPQLFQPETERCYNTSGIGWCLAKAFFSNICALVYLRLHLVIEHLLPVSLCCNRTLVHIIQICSVIWFGLAPTLGSTQINTILIDVWLYMFNGKSKSYAFLCACAFKFRASIVLLLRLEDRSSRKQIVFLTQMYQASD